MVLILMAIDDSEHSVRAWENYMETVYRPTDTLLLVHAIEIPYVSPEPMRADLLQQMLQKCKDEAAVLEAKFKQRVEQTGMTYEIISEFSNPGHLICRLANKHNPDMIIMGTRGMGKLRRTILGSVSSYVVHHAHCPVMICRH